MFKWFRDRFGTQPPTNTEIAKAVHKGAASLVIRSREGDQNAMGILFMIGEQARKGNDKAMRAMRAVQQYIKQHPNRPVIAGESESEIGADDGVLSKLHRATRTEDLGRYAFVIVRLVPICSERAITVLSHGPDVFHDAERLKVVSEAVPDQTAFVLGLAGEQSQFGSEGEATSWHIGRCVGLARKIQAVKNGAPIAMLNPKVAWELR
jgi:hypothetical protein